MKYYNTTLILDIKKDNKTTVTTQKERNRGEKLTVLLIYTRLPPRSDEKIEMLTFFAIT